MTDVRNVFRAISVDKDIRAVVVSGSGRMFTAGLDCRFERVPQDEIYLFELRKTIFIK